MAAGLTARIRYLITRARAVDLRNVWRLAGLARRTSARPRLAVVVDMLWCSVRYEAAFQDYADWDFHLLNPRERATWMTHPKSNHLALRLNSRDHRELFSDKARFVARFAEYVGREWIDIRESDTQQVREFVVRHGTVMAKLTDGLGGKGIQKKLASDVTEWDGFVAELTRDRQYLIEEFIDQHPDMARLCPTSVNTLRIVTYLDGENVHVLASVLKIGNGGAIDNFSHGGMYTMVDERGHVEFPAFDGDGRTYSVHPLSGEPIVGFSVPDYVSVLELVRRMAPEVPEIPYVGWDIAITSRGPVVIEGNYNTGVFQSKPSVSGIRTGLLPRYRAAIGF